MVVRAIEDVRPTYAYPRVHPLHLGRIPWQKNPIPSGQGKNKCPSPSGLRLWVIVGVSYWLLEEVGSLACEVVRCSEKSGTFRS